MKFTGEKKQQLYDLVGRNIDMYTANLERLVGTKDPKHEELKHTVARAKVRCDQLYLKIGQEKTLDQKDLMLLLTCIKTVQTLLLNQRKNIDFTIRTYDDYYAEIIEEGKIE